ncbi:SDR family oxidoreductase [Nocardia sp. CA-128927]|uniref:SDR family oxidoreductase n=1 Tax=Nocardia sp. CA-128927 TaxID=3239975 RepID=UPI003D95A7B8
MAVISVFPFRERCEHRTRCAGLKHWRSRDCLISLAEHSHIPVSGMACKTRARLHSRSVSEGRSVIMTHIIEGSVVLITGANGGLGEEFVAQALARGARKVYATARKPRDWSDPRVVPLVLDVTDPASVAAAAEAATDVTVVLNNAGISFHNELAETAIDDVRRMFDTNFFGALDVATRFAPTLRRNGGGVLLNVLSLLSWVSIGGAYSASKAALWSATNALRLELAPHGTLVVGLHLGPTDTPMNTGYTAPMNDPADVVRIALNGIEAGEFEVLADDICAEVKQKLAAPIETMYPQLVEVGGGRGADSTRVSLAN